ncbi:MAG: AzlC family ABC transporter permease [Oscillospiraceae bacterium]
MKKEFKLGMYHGIPIGLGYLSVSFGFGIMAVKSGLTTLVAALISASNLTSAGQAAGVGVIAAGGSLIEMALVQLTINLRYSLMALSLSQKLDRSFTLPHKLLAAFGITDEIFAVSAGRKEKLTPWYMYGMIMVSFAGWVTGTFLGASAGELLPASVSAALSIMLYGMFIAIIVPPSRKEKSVLTVVVIAALISILLRYCQTVVSGGFAVIISAVAASAAGAFLFPVRDEEESH